MLLLNKEVEVEEDKDVLCCWPRVGVGEKGSAADESKILEEEEEEKDAVDGGVL